MLKWAIIFAVIALVAGALGFGGIAGAAAGIAKLLFFPLRRDLPRVRTARVHRGEEDIAARLACG